MFTSSGNVLALLIFVVVAVAVSMVVDRSAKLSKEAHTTPARKLPSWVN